MWVGLVQSVEGLNRTKSLASSWVIAFLGKQFCPTAFKLGHWPFLYLWTQNIGSSCVWSLSAFRWELHICLPCFQAFRVSLELKCGPSWISSLLTHPAVWDLSPSSCEPIPYHKSPFLSLYTILLVLFLWRTLHNASCLYIYVYLCEYFIVCGSCSVVIWVVTPSSQLLQIYSGR